MLLFIIAVPEFEMKTATSSIAEGAGKVGITVKRDPATGTLPAFTLKLDVEDNEAKAGSEFTYDGTPLSVKFAQNDLEATVSIPIMDDKVCTVHLYTYSFTV